MRTVRFVSFPLWLLVIFLIGCGGGGGGGNSGGDQGSTAAVAEGGWVGRLTRSDGVMVSSDYGILTVALENDEVWTFLYNPVLEYLLDGVIKVTGKTSGNTYTGTGVEYYKDVSGILKTTVNAAVTPGVSLDINVSYTNPRYLPAQVRLESSSKKTLLSGAVYDYSRAADLNVLSRAKWPDVRSLGMLNNVISGFASNWEISNTGELKNNNLLISDCNFTGTFKPRSSGRNVYDVTIKLVTNSLCRYPGVTLNGIAVLTTKSNTTSVTQTLYVMVANPENTLIDGFVMRNSVSN